ncbi:YybH family protein [Larkinella terrae]|uniref:DUF4440 domain-containing protein n=1 Tax=Larkinella terrae TaxID=2025311 RepID=A0A7K0ET66_9BACT|nr:nuclear transport factor 2 family protein [Larkinella terrae]MRS65010.1 DUF4440 domain-containing protein [Larkinella terrae]
MKALAYSLVLGLLSVACTTSTTSTEPVNVQEMNQQFIRAWNSKESDKIIAYLADDVQFVQGSSHWQGKSEVSNKWVRETLPTLDDLKTYAVSSGTDEKTAYEAGTFSVDVLPANQGEPHGTGEGNYMLLWKKGTDNNWKLSYAQLEDLPVHVK